MTNKDKNENDDPSDGVVLEQTNHIDQLFTSLEDQRNNASFTDVTINCEDGKIHAHSCILASAESEPIMAILKEGRNSIDTFKFSSFIWQTILRMLYTGKVNCPVDSLIQLKTACITLGMQRMISLCAEAEQQAQKMRELERIIQIRAELKAAEKPKLSSSKLRYKCVRCNLLYVNRDAKLRHQRHAHNADILRDPTPHQRRSKLLRLEHDKLSKLKTDYKISQADDSDSVDTQSSTKPALFMELIDAKKRIYRCKICDMTFITGKNVKRHEESHVKEMMAKDNNVKELYKPEPPKFENGKRIYKCDICDKQFPNGKNISRHKRTRHGVDVLGFPIPKDKPNYTLLVPCPICGKTFSSQRNLKCHQSRVHKVEKVDIYNSNLQKSILESSYESSQDLSLEPPTIYDTPPSSSAVFPDQL